MRFQKHLFICSIFYSRCIFKIRLIKQAIQIFSQQQIIILSMHVATAFSQFAYSFLRKLVIQTKSKIYEFIGKIAFIMGKNYSWHNLLIIHILQEGNSTLFARQTFFVMIVQSPKTNKPYLFLNLFILTLLFSILHAQNTNNATSNTNNNLTSTVPKWLNSSTTQFTSFTIDQYNYFITNNGNKVWTAAMSLAWEEMKRSFLLGQNATFKNMTDLQEKMVSNLNAQLFTRKQLSESCYYVSSGYGSKAQERINFEVRNKFPNKMFEPLKFELKDQDFLVYSYLQKIFRFKVSFSGSTGFKFKNNTVEGFQTRFSKQRKQLYYKYYTHQNDFLIGIETDNQADQILMLKTNRTQVTNFTVAKVLQLVQLYSLLPNKKIAKTDVFRMPVLNFDFTRQYKEMIQLKFANQYFEDYEISQMQEKLKLLINKDGVQVYNQAVITISRTSLLVQQKLFILNSDFWLILKQKNKKPYLMILVRSVNETWTG